MSFGLPILPELDNPLLGFRFGVFFLRKLLPEHPLDFRFQSVSGISIEAETNSKGESRFSGDKDNPTGKSKNSPLILKRGMPLISTLSISVIKSLIEKPFRPKPGMVLISILDENAIPFNSWIFSEAYPVKWSFSDLGADSDSIIVEELELEYESFKPIWL